jgi:hypothetical protein
MLVFCKKASVCRRIHQLLSSEESILKFPLRVSTFVGVVHGCMRRQYTQCPIQQIHTFVNAYNMYNFANLSLG